jgi:hypothetical protein
MNKVMAFLFGFCALGGFALSQRSSFQSQNVNRWGAPIGEVRTVSITPAGRIGYIAFGAVCMAGCLFFLAQIRNEDTRPPDATAGPAKCPPDEHQWEFFDSFPGNEIYQCRICQERKFVKQKTGGETHE